MFGCVSNPADPEKAELYFKLGNAYFDLGKFPDAVNAYLRALDYDESLKPARYNLARVYVETGRIEEAEEIVLELLEEEPENTLLMSTLAWVRYIDGDVEGALEQYQNVLDRLPGDTDTLFNISRIYEELEREEDALSTLLELYDREPDPQYLSRIARLYETTGNPESAAQYLELYLDQVKEPKEAIGQFHQLARVYATLEEYGEAYKKYNTAIEMSEEKNTGELLFERSRILLLYIEDYESGLADLRASLEKGFAERERLDELLEEIVPGQVDEVREMYAEYGIGAGDREPGSGSAPDTNSEGTGAPP